MDGDLIVQSTIESIRSGVGADKPLVMGANDDEFSMIFAEAKNKLKWIPASFMLGRIRLRGPKRGAYMQANAEVKSWGTFAAIGRYLTDSIFRTFTAAPGIPQWCTHLGVPFLLAIPGDNPPRYWPTSCMRPLHGSWPTATPTGQAMAPRD